MPATASAEVCHERPWRIPLALFLGALALYLAGTWSLPLIDRDEPRFAEASREMRQREDWIVPWLNNKPRYDKPPLVYWLQIAAYREFGENTFSARLPSALAGALTVLTIYGFGRRLRDARTGLWAAIIFGTCLQTVVHSRLAVADMLMILFFTTAAWSGWELLVVNASPSSHPSPPVGEKAPEGRLRGRFAWWLAFYVSLGLAFLAKGPVGVLPLLLPILTPLLRREAVPWSRLQIGWGLILSLGIIATWGVPALIQTKGEFWDVGMGRHVIERSVGVLDGHGASRLVSYLATVPLYFVTIFFSFFPWAFWLPGLIRGLWPKRRALSRDQVYLVTGVAIIFVLFSLVRTKLPHYTLPAFPLLALLLAVSWTDKSPELPAQRRWATGMVVVSILMGLLAFPFLARLFPSAQLFEACSPWLQPETQLASTSFEEPSVAWSFRSRIRGFHQVLPPNELPRFMARKGPRLCLLPTDQVSTLFPTIPVQWKQAQTTGFNTANGKRVDLTALVKTAAD